MPVQMEECGVFLLGVFGLYMLSKSFTKSRSEKHTLKLIEYMKNV